MYCRNAGIAEPTSPAAPVKVYGFRLLLLKGFAYGLSYFHLLSQLKQYIMRFLISVSLLLTASVVEAQNFSRITTGPFVTTPGDSRSVNWIDVNNDGLPDCQITNGPSGGQNNALYINTGNGNFTALVNDTIVRDGKPSDGATWADADNDGNSDAFVANWYNVNNLLYMGSGNAAFTQVSTGDPVNNAGYSETAAWGDYDTDGFVDLYVTNSAGNKKNFLYHNNGNGTYTRILTGNMVNDAFESRCVNWTDLDYDGDLDIFVTNENGQNENIYRNDGGGTFVSVTAGPLLNDGGPTMSSSWADYDNDGDLDVFLANDLGNDALFRNDGNFVFTKMVNDTVSKSGGNSFSSAWSDVDNDGDLDLYVTNAFWANTKLVNFFFLNNGNGTFTRNSSSAVVADSAWSYGCAFADYDNDGFEDLAVATVRYNNVDEPDLLYHNDGNSNNWITITLQGTMTNRAAIGTKIRLRAIINGNPVWQLREISAQNAYCSQNDWRAHFGLGNATAVDTVIVEWLGTNPEIYTGISVNQFITITEGNGINGIINNKTAPAFRMDPNPSTGYFTLYAGANGSDGYRFGKNDLLRISDTSGKVVKELHLQPTQSNTVIDLHQLPAGVYFVTLLTPAGSSTRKIIIQ